jgi:WD40 repeat protein
MSQHRCLGSTAGEICSLADYSDAVSRLLAPKNILMMYTCRTSVLTASADGTAKLWSIETGACTQTFTGHKDIARSAVFSGDGASVLTESLDGTAQLWSIVTGACSRTFTTAGRSRGSEPCYVVSSLFWRRRICIDCQFRRHCEALEHQDRGMHADFYRS